MSRVAKCIDNGPMEGFWGILKRERYENDVYNFPTWQYCKYKDIFDSHIIINSTAKFYISISYQKDLLSIDTRIFTPSEETQIILLMSLYLLSNYFLSVFAL